MNSRRRICGFTLVELLVVISIIGVLATLIVPTVSKAMEMIRTVMTRSTIKQLTIALDNFKSDFGAYPPSKPRVPLDVTKTKTDLTSGEMSTGAANLVFYIRGPDSSGWGRSAAGAMPFGGMPSRSYGPYFDAGDNTLKYDSNNVVAGFLDSYSPPGIILYFRANVSSTGIVSYEVSDNTLSLGVSIGVGDSTGKTNYASQSAFDECVTSGTTSQGGKRYVRQDFLLVSPGVDARYGYMMKNDQGEIVPGAKANNMYDDMKNWD